MASEILLNVVVQVSNSPYKDLFAPGQIAVDQAAIGCGGYVQSIGTSEEVVVTGDVATLGYCVLQNLDAANFVEYGPESAGAMVAFGKLKAGEVAVLRLKPAITIRAKADTGAVKLLVKVYEN